MTKLLKTYDPNNMTIGYTARTINSQPKVWDITPAVTKWQKQYAKLEYRRIMWHDLWQATTYIEVRFV
jgi:hypothetical protein